MAKTINKLTKKIYEKEMKKYKKEIKMNNKAKNTVPIINYIMGDGLAEIYRQINRMNNYYIKSITANENKKIVTVVFNDGIVHMSKCSEEDYFDINVGVAMCIAYRNFNSKTQMHKFVEKTAKVISKKEKKE